MVTFVTGAGLGLIGASASVIGKAGQLDLEAAGRGPDVVTVNARTGNLVVQHQDELLVGRGPDIGVVRTYNSGATFDFDNNDSWQLSLYRKFGSLTGTVNSVGSTIKQSSADGAQRTYTYDATLGYYANKDGGGAYDTLAYNHQTDTWLWTDGDSRIVEAYEAAPVSGEWRISRLSDLDGNIFAYSYDTNGLINEVCDANGETTRLLYDGASGQLNEIQIVTSDGATSTRIRYVYDANGRLSAVITDLTPADGSIADGNVYTTTYTYDGASTRLASLVNSDGTRLYITYDAEGRVASLTDGAGLITTLAYNACSTTITDPLGQASTLTHNDEGNLVRLQGPAGSGWDIRYDYNVNGDLVQLADSRGNVIAYTYDANGNLIGQQDGVGNVVEHAYNSGNQLIKKTIYATPDPDGAGSSQAGAPQVTYYVRDAGQRLRFTVTPEGRVTEYRYNAQGQQTSSLVYSADTYAIGAIAPVEADLVAWVETQDKTRLQRTDTQYDARGLSAAVIRYARTDGDGIGLADGSQSVTHYVYDSAGRLLQQVDPRGTATPNVDDDYVTAYAYDGLGRSISVTRYDGAGNSSSQTQTTFNDTLNRVEMTLANGLVRVASYDTRGLLVSQVEQDGTTVLVTETRQYDAAGRLRVITDANGNKTHFFYDSLGRKTGELDAVGGLTEYLYNDAGQVIRTVRYATTVGADLISLFAPDGDGVIPNVAISAVRPSTSEFDQVSRGIYDAAGRLCFSIDARGHVVENRYDGAGRMLATVAYANALNNPEGIGSLGREATPADIQILATAPESGQIGLLQDSANDRLSRNFYDNDGLLRGTLDGEGYLTELQYDAAGRLIQSVRYGTAAAANDRAIGTLGTLVASANANLSANITSFAWYNGQGQLVGSLDGEGFYTTSQYDLAGNRTRSTRYANRLVGSPVAGSLPQVVAEAPSVSVNGGYVLLNPQDQLTQATWNAFGQIETETAANGTLTRYTYDAMGGRLSAVTAAGAADIRSQQTRYDMQGRLVQELADAGNQALAALGEAPTQAQVEAVWAVYGITHAYDAGGRRIRSTDTNGNVTLFFYDAANRRTFSVRRVRNPDNVGEWVGEVSARQFNAQGQLTAEIQYANRIGAALFATLTGGAESQVTAADVIVSDAEKDSRTDYTYLLTGELSTSSLKLNATETALSTLIRDAFGAVTARHTQLDAGRTRREEFSYDRRGLLVESRRDVAWAGNSSATGVAVSNVYDAFGRVIGSTDGRGVVRTATYDRLGRQVSTVIASGSLNLTQTTTFDAFGRVLTQTDAQGNVTTTAYATDADSGQTTIFITTPEGIVTRTVTDRYGQTLTVVDGRGNEIHHRYDAEGHLISTRRWDKQTDVETLIEARNYDAAGNLLSVQDANGNSIAYSYDAANRLLSRRIDPSGLNLVTTYAYDAKGQQVSITDANNVVTRTTFDLGGRQVLVAVDPDGLNLRTRYAYDLDGRRLAVVEGYGMPEARTSLTDYDSLGRRIRTVADPGGLNLTTTYAYDQNDNLVARTEAAGTSLSRTTRYSYDAADRLVYTVDAQGGVVKNDYDANSRILRRTEYAAAINVAGLSGTSDIDDISALVTADAARDRATRHVYDTDGRERFTIDAIGAVTENQYDANGNVTQRIRYANALEVMPELGSAPQVVASTADRVTVNAYDEDNRLISRTEAFGTAVARMESWGYDGAGNAIRHTDARGNRTWFAYDNANRLLRTIDAGGYVTDTIWNADGSKHAETHYANAVALSANDDAWAYAGHAANPVADTDTLSGDRTTRYTYDAAGRRQTVTDALGYVTRNTYDALGNLIDTTTADGTPLASILHRDYDKLGRVIAETRGDGTPEASRTTYAYDAQGNQTSLVEAASTAVARTTVQEFDLLGRKTATTDGAGARTLTAYNCFGDIVKVTDALGNAGYFYSDALGRVTLQVDPEGSVTETRYDLFGDVTETRRYANPVVGAVSENICPQILGASGSGVHAVRNDAADQRQQAFYDALGRKTEIRTWWGTNAADYYTETFTYDANGNVLVAQVRNGAVTAYAYDALNRKVQEILPITSKDAGNDDTAVENRFAYDALGNLTQRIEAYALPEQRITTYAYDKLNRLLAETGEAIVTFDPATQSDAIVTPVKRKIYDAAGNLVEETDARGQRTLHFYNALRQETGRIDAAGTYTAWTYDAAGNKTSQTIHANAVQVAGGGPLPNTGVPALVATVPGAGAYVLVDAANDRTVYFSYDGSGRQTGTRIDNLTTGAYNPNVGGGTYQVASGNLVTAVVHDALGNVVKTTDANGNVSRGYFNKAGQKVGQLDAKRYLTVWGRDAAGNVTSETRYANAVGSSLNIGDGTPLATLLANVAVSGDDRVTVTAYDRLNRVTTETRKGVATGTVNGGNGVLTETVADAVTAYAYDGLGNVVRKTDAVGAVTDWTYDGLGRETREQRPSCVDHLGVSVRPTTDTEYDGLNHLRREIERGTDSATETDDRITAYTYGAGGFLASQTDAAGAVTQYRVDANGNVTKKTLVGRLNADGGAVNDVTLYRYDAANRQVKSTDLATGTTQDVRYNAFGEITGKRTDGGGAQAAWTEFAEYDRAGRAWKSNTGDGATKVYVLDGNGNATLTIQSTGSELAAQSLATVLARTDTLKTIAVFDARNQLAETFLPTMEAVHELVAVQANSAGQTVFVSNASAISIGAQSSLGGTAPATVTPLVAGGLSAIGGSSVEKVTYIYSGGPPWLAPFGISAQIHIDLPNLSTLGDGNLRIRVTKICSGAANSQADYSFSGTQTAIDLPSIPVHFEYADYGGYTTVSLGISIYKQTALGELLLTQTSRGGPDYVNTTQVITNAPLAKVVRFTTQPTNASRVALAYRSAGSTGAYTLVNATQMTNTAGALMAGWFAYDWSALSGSNYEIQYMALDAAGKVLNKQSGTLNLTNPAAPAVVQNNGALGPIGGFGRGLVDSSGKLNILEQGNATGLTLKYRVKGSGAAWTALNLGNASPFGVATPGWFSLAYASYFAANTAYELEITASNGATVINEARAEFSRDAAGNSTLSAFTAKTQPAIVQLTERADTSYVDIDYRPLGSTGAYTTLRVNPSAVGGGRFDWDASALVPVATSNYDYDVVLRAYSAGGLLNNQTAATIRLGANAAVLSATNQNAPHVLRLTPPQAGGASIKLGYRLQGSNSDYTSLGTTAVGGEFRVDLAGLGLPASGSLVYEYVYDVFDGNGALLGRNNGHFTLQAAGASASRLDWVIQNVASVSNRIHRSQATNAFGDVIRETDGLGRITDLAYNAAGQLVSKQTPETDVTLDNGFVQRIRTTTRFVYDLSGRLIATIDPNGNTNTQVWLAGGAKDEIVLERHADGGLLTHGYDVFGDKRVDVDALGNRTDTAYDKLSRIVQVKRPQRAAGTPGNTGTAPIQAVDSYAYDAAGNRIAHTNALGDVEKTYYDSLGRVVGSRDYLGFATTYTYTYSNAILGLGGAQVGGWRKTTTNAVGRTLVDDQDVFGRTTWHQDLGGRQFTYRYNAAGWLTEQTGSNGQNIVTDHYANGYVKSVWDKATGAYTHYEYDAEGNRIFEGCVYLKNPADLNGGVRDYYQYANIEYDEHNRVKRILDPKAEIRYEFDANGNRRRVLSTYHDGLNGAMRTQDYWYQYDAMNRFTVTMGQLSTGTRGTSAADTTVAIVKGSTGTAIAYDLGGQRRQASNGSDGTIEDYSYSADGFLEDVRINGVLRSRRNEDLLGRVTAYTEWNSAGTQSYSRSTTYDKNNRILAQSGSDGSTTNTYYTDATDNAGTASQSGAGELAKSVTTSGGTTVSSYFAYDYWDDAKEKAVTAQAWNPIFKGNNAYWRPGYAYHAYDVNGHLQEAADAGADGALGTADDRSFRYVSDAQGLILLRDEIAAGRVNRVQRYYYANGVRVGDVGNDGLSRTDYTQAIARRGVDRKNYKNWSPVASADFDQNYEPVSPAYPGVTPGTYTVRAGDTLQGIARSVWGDASLWYLIADANGLNGTETLKAGQVLSLPNKLTNVHNNAGTFRPYNPGEAVGDTSPTIPTPPPVPKPKGKKGCGGVGSIIVAIVVVVATIYTAGAASVAMGSSAATTAATAAGGVGTFAGTMAAGVSAMSSMTAIGLAAAAIGGAVGSLVGQGMSMAMGLQDKFSWGAVAAGALGGAAGAAAGGALGGGNVLVSAAASNVASQGVNLLTGQQKKFSWASLAASVISAPIAQGISGSLTGAGDAFAASDTVTRALVGSATRALVSAVTRVAIEGGRLRWESVAADALSGAIREAYSSARGAYPVGNNPDEINIEDLPPELRTASYANILRERGIPYALDRDTDRLYFASIDRNGQFVRQAGDEVVNLKAYRNDDGSIAYIAPDASGRYDLPAGVSAIDVKELRYEGQSLGRDFGPIKEWVDAIRAAGVTAGDPAGALRLQVAVDAARHPELAQFIDAGTGQVNPLQWQEFQSAAIGAGVPMVVASNGLGNLYQQARDNIRILAEGKDALAVNVYNPTIDGAFLADTLAEALPAVLWGQRQTVQVAIQSQLREAIGYNARLNKELGLESGSLKTEFIGHSQGTINGNLAIGRMDERDEKPLIRVFNVGSASPHLPEGVSEFINIVDKNDPVTNLTNGRAINDSPYALERPSTYRLVETDIRQVLGPGNAGNRHSFYLYAQTPEFHRQLGFVPRPTPLIVTRPF